jgi:Uma2 family endonuclease
VFDPRAEGQSSYRTPDLVVFATEHRSDRGVEGRASLAVEIRSPGNESLEKLPFYARVGVAEVLVVDRDSKLVRRWVLSGGSLAEEAADPAARHHLNALPARLRGHDGRLFIEGPAGTTVI